MLIIDSQVHVWPPDRPDRPLGPGHTERTPYSYQQLIADMDRAGIDRAILVPPSIDANRNDYAVEAVRKHPGRFAIMGKVPLKPAAPDALKGWREKPGMLGVRLSSTATPTVPGSPTAPPTGSGRRPSTTTSRSWCMRPSACPRS